MNSFNLIKKYIFFILVLSVFYAQPSLAQKGSLFFSPQSESFKTGQTFTVDLNLDTAGTLINAAEVKIYFPAENIEALRVSKDGSIFSFWPEEPLFSNEAGEISFVAGLPHPGFSGTGKIVTIEFKAKKEGEAIICFDESKILADDGQGTNILIFIKNPKYFIYQSEQLQEKSLDGSAPNLFSSTHPKEEEWYGNNNPHFDWEMGAEAQGTSFELNQSPDTMPDDISEGLTESKDYSAIKDGIWYFHLKIKTKNGWTNTRHYKINIDTQPPEPFEIAIDNKGDSTNPNPSLYFETQDKVSGIEKYRIKIGDSDFSDLLTAQISPKLSPGSHKIIVRAIDKAFNVVRAKTIINVDPIETPEVSIIPEKYLAGEETLYMEGTSLPKVEIIIYLKAEGEEIRQWKTTSNDKGEWSFFTNELIRPGTYTLSVMAQDNRGAISNLSLEKRIDISFSGLSLGGIMVTFKNLILALFVFLLLGIVFAFWHFYRAGLTKKKLKKEIKEAKDSLINNFSGLEKEIEKKIGLVDSQPGLNEEEKKAYERIRESLKAAQQAIDKEIKDIEKELK